MIIELKKDIGAEERQAIVEKLTKLKYKSNEVRTQRAEYLIGIGKNDFDIRDIGFMPGIADIFRVSDNYKLVSSKWKVHRTVLDLGDGGRYSSFYSCSFLCFKTGSGLPL